MVCRPARGEFLFCSCSTCKLMASRIQGCIFPMHIIHVVCCWCLVDLVQWSWSRDGAAGPDAVLLLNWVDHM